MTDRAALRAAIIKALPVDWDGGWGLYRTVRWSWPNDLTPGWLSELARAEIGGAS
jgi:hypothetical protein